MGLAVAPKRWISPRARLVLMMVLLTACAQDHGETAVATVGTKEITAEELRHFVRRLAPSLVSDESGQQAREDYLQTLVDREIALLAAYEKGLDQDPDLLKTLDSEKSEHLLSLYRDQEILPQIQVSEEEIRQFFDRQDMTRERRTTAILVRTREQAQQIRAQLEAGSDFGELARTHSLDTWSALREGELGFVTRAAAERLLGIPVAVFDTLGPGQVSPPLRRGRNYHLIRFLEDRPTDLQTHREAIRTQLQEEKQRALAEEQADILAREFNWQLVSAGANLLKDKGAALGESGRLQLTDEEKRVPLFTYGGGTISLAAYMAVLRQHRIRAPRALLDSAFIGLLGRRFLQQPALFVAAAERLGLAEDPEVVAWVEKTRRELLVRGIRQREVIDQIAIDEADVRRFYDENEAMFRRESFEQARRRAEVALRKALEKERFDTWIAALRQRYEDRVKIFPERLAKALPQALLDSLARN